MYTTFLTRFLTELPQELQQMHAIGPKKKMQKVHVQIEWQNYPCYYSIFQVLD